MFFQSLVFRLILSYISSTELYSYSLILKITASVVCSCTDEQQVKGLCGLHVEYETEDRDSDRKMYPWLAYVNVQVSNVAFR